MSWAATLAGYDDDALAALANKGLVRRAKKDAPPVLRAQDAETLEAEADGQTVTLRVPLTAATCTCDSGVCRHILAVILAARNGGDGEEASKADVAAELLAIDADTVAAWAGLPLLKKAAVSLAHGFEVEETPGAVAVRLPAQNVVVRSLGGGIDALLCSCHATGPCEHKAAALLAFRAEKLGEDPSLEPAALQEKAGAVRTREGVREAVTGLLEELVTLGLCRLPASAEGRLRTLGTAAHGVDLPRLERELTGLAEVVRLVRARHAGGDTAALLTRAARTYALAHALAAPTAALVGVHRSSYLPVAGAVELIGLGAARWRTGSGYHGLTVYFWQPGEAGSSGRWTSWTDARPVDTRGFDPAGRFGSDPPWAGAASPRDAARKRWRVTGLHRNAEGRVSARDGTRGSSAGKAETADGPRVERFADLNQIRERLAGVGLSSDTGPLDALALVRPTAWGPPVHDAVTQRASRELVDADGDTLTLSVTHGPAAGDAVSSLLKLDGGDMLCRLRADGTAEPVTVWRSGKPLHLTLDPAPSGAASAASAETRVTPRRPLADALGGVLLSLREQAEAGASVPRPAPAWPVTPPPAEGLAPAVALLRHAWFAQLAADAA